MASVRRTARCVMTRAVQPEPYLADLGCNDQGIVQLKPQQIRRGRYVSWRKTTWASVYVGCSAWAVWRSQYMRLGSSGGAILALAPPSSPPNFLSPLLRSQWPWWTPYRGRALSLAPARPRVVQPLGVALSISSRRFVNRVGATPRVVQPLVWLPVLISAVC